ncbi:MAG: hypothetical protein M3P94_01460 [Chloroflexota bacterium]|nr:hypothetical protein [Chloroflexota bacterium]
MLDALNHQIAELIAPAVRAIVVAILAGQLAAAVLVGLAIRTLKPTDPPDTPRPRP